MSGALLKAIHVYSCGIFLLTIRELALFQHLAEALAELVVALALGALDELFELIGAALLLLRGLLLVHGLRLLLVRLLKKTQGR